MFTYTTTKQDNVATITLDGSYMHDIYVAPEPQHDEDFSGFNL